MAGLDGEVDAGAVREIVVDAVEGDGLLLRGEVVGGRLDGDCWVMMCIDLGSFETVGRASGRRGSWGF